MVDSPVSLGAWVPRVAWTPLQLAANWSAFPAGEPAPAYGAEQSGVIHLEGICVWGQGVTPQGQTIGSAPPPRNGGNRRFIVLCYLPDTPDGGAFDWGWVELDAGGALSVQLFPDNGLGTGLGYANAWLTLDGHHYQRSGF